MYNLVTYIAEGVFVELRMSSIRRQSTVCGSSFKSTSASGGPERYSNL